MKICALHLAGGRPYVLEDRWINVLAVPDIKGVDFNLISANEWLVANVRYSHGDILFSARSADATLAERLGAGGSRCAVCDRAQHLGRGHFNHFRTADIRARSQCAHNDLTS